MKPQKQTKLKKKTKLQQKMKAQQTNPQETHQEKLNKVYFKLTFQQYQKYLTRWNQVLLKNYQKFMKKRKYLKQKRKPMIFS